MARLETVYVTQSHRTQGLSKAHTGDTVVFGSRGVAQVICQRQTPIHWVLRNKANSHRRLSSSRDPATQVLGSALECFVRLP